MECLDWGKRRYGSLDSISMQLCVNVQIPSQGGLNGSAVYIDTEGSLNAIRLSQIAQGALKRFPNAKWSEKDILSKIHLYRPVNATELMDVLQQLKQKLEQDPSIKLIVIDSIAFHFRQFDDMGNRSRQLQTIGSLLREIASVFQVAIVTTNHMTTRIAKKATGDQTLMVPALGLSWGHTCTHRILLYWQQDERHAWVSKSPLVGDKSCSFSVTVLVFNVDGWIIVVLYISRLSLHIN